MIRKLALALPALVLVLALGAGAALAGAARSQADPGVTDDLDPARRHLAALRLGVRLRLGRPRRQRLLRVRQLEGRRRSAARSRTRILDDGYNPAQTVQQTRQLVEQDKVFAIFNALGTEHNLAIRDYLNAQKVPQLFAASGATTFGREAAKYPYTIGFQPSYQAEGWVLGKYLARTQGAAKVAVLFQNDDYGKDLLTGLKRGLQRSKVKDRRGRAVRGDRVATSRRRSRS